MPYNLFGFLFKSNNDPINDQPVSFAPPSNDDGAIVMEGGTYVSTIDLDGVVKNEIELITKYRELSMRAEVDGAISEIVNESIVVEQGKTPISLITDKLEYSDAVIQKIQDEFDNILSLLDFNNEGQDIFRRWYIDGRLYFHIVIDPDNPQNGIQELRNIDPRRIKPVIETDSVLTHGGVPIQLEKQRYFVYNQFGTDSMAATTGVKVTWDSICYVHSGIQETNNTLIFSHLQKALKPANMLAMASDAQIIYRLCLKGDSRILTPKGYRYISEIRQGDDVYSISPDQILYPTKVTKQWSNGQEQVVRVASQHHEIYCTKQHPILVRDNRTGVIVYVKAEELRPKIHQLIHVRNKNFGQDIYFPKIRDTNYVLKDKTAWSGLKIPAKEALINSIAGKIDYTSTKIRNFLYGQQSLPKPIAILVANNVPTTLVFDEKVEGTTTKSMNLPEIVNEDFSRLFGFLIGDGSVDTNKITFASGVDPIQNEYYADLLRGFFETSEYYPTKDRQYCNYSTNNTLGAELLKEMGFLTGAKRKRIPSWVFLAKDNIKRAFIEGLCEADGCIRYTSKGTWFCTVELANKRLIEDIKEIWTSIGLNSGKITSREREHGGVIDGRTIGYSKTWQITLTKLELPQYENVISIKVQEGTTEVFDIEVESGDHNFIVNGVASHNSRAPERRVIYVDVGNMPKLKAEQYLKEVMSKYRNRMVYDASTGEIKEDKKFLSFMEDYWLPRREGGKGTEITTLEGGENLGEIADIEFFKEGLYQSLNVPVSRLKSESTMSFGDGATITREEVKFGKFVQRLRNRFTQLFDELLSTQLMLKQIISAEDWVQIKQKIFYSFLKDTYYSELKNLEILQNRISAVDRCVPYAGKLISWEYVRRNILMQTDEEMKELDAQMEKEKDDPRYQQLEAMMGAGGGMMGGMDGQMGGPGMENNMNPPQPQAPEMNNSLGDDQENSENEPENNVNKISNNVEKLWRR